MIQSKPLDSTNPSLVKEYSYNPVLVWLRAWFFLEEPVTDSMISGKENASTLKGVGQLYGRNKSGSTVIDELHVEKDDLLMIIERKAYRSYNYSRYVEQAVVSYIIANMNMPGIHRVKLEIQNTTRAVDLNQELIEDVEKIIEKTIEIIKNEKPPKPKQHKEMSKLLVQKILPKLVKSPVDRGKQTPR